MDLNEVKDLYAEGLTLFKRIQKYGKEYPYEETERVDKVGLFLFSEFTRTYILLFFLKQSLTKSESSRFINFQLVSYFDAASLTAYLHCIFKEFPKQRLMRNLI